MTKIFVSLKLISFQTSGHDTKNPNNEILFHLETVANKGSHSFRESHGVFNTAEFSSE